MGWKHLSPNGEYNDCVGPSGCSYGDATEGSGGVLHFKDEAAVKAHKEEVAEAREAARRGRPEERVDLTEQQVRLIPVSDAAAYAADNRARVEFSKVDKDYWVGRFFGEESAMVVAEPSPRSMTPFAEWGGVDVSGLVHRAEVSAAGRGSSAAANVKLANDLVGAHRAGRQDGQTAVRVIAAEERNPSFVQLAKHRQQYLNRIMALGEQRYAEYAVCAFEHFERQHRRSLAKHTGKILERLLSSPSLSDAERVEVRHAAAYILQEHDEFQSWVGRHDTDFSADGLPIPADAAQLRDLVDSCSSKPDRYGDMLVMATDLEDVGFDGLDFSQMVTPVNVVSPEQTPEEVVIAQTSKDDPDLRDDLRALEWNDAVAHSYVTYTKQARRRKFGEAVYSHYTNPAYHNLGGREYMPKVRPGDIICRPGADGRTEYAVTLRNTGYGVLYQTIGSYTMDESPVIVDADRALALYNAGARINETPIGITAYPGSGTTLEDEGWAAY